MGLLFGINMTNLLCMHNKFYYLWIPQPKVHERFDH